MTLSPPNSRWSSLVFFSVFLHLSHAYLFPLSKKTSSRSFSFFSLLFVLHFLHPIHCKSLWDLICLVSWGDKCFSLWWTRFHRFHVSGLAEDFRSNRSIQLGDTDFTTGKTFCHLFLLYSWSSSTQWILSSASITFTLMLCTVIQGPNPFTTNSRRPFLEIDVKGGERDHIKA